MSDNSGEVEVESGSYAVLPKEVTDEIGSIKLFNKWTYEDVEIRDISLTDYIQIRSPVYIAHSAGRYAVKRFRKAQCPIIERLTNSLMMNGRNNGKAHGRPYCRPRFRDYPHHDRPKPHPSRC